jgi:membrane protein EpsK
LLILPIVVLLAYYSPSFFEIPSNQENATRILLALRYFMWITQT